MVACATIVTPVSIPARERPRARRLRCLVLRRRARRAPAGAAAPARPDALDVRAAVLTGAAIGVLGGLVGLILGSLRMPALLKWVGEAPSRAVGTNLAVGFCVGVAGVIGHLPGG